MCYEKLLGKVLCVDINTMKTKGGYDHKTFYTWIKLSDNKQTEKEENVRNIGGNRK